jgi:tight adherence protein B
VGEQVIIPLLTFTVFFLGIYGVYWLTIVRPEEQAVGIIKRRLRATRQKATRKVDLRKEVQALSSIGAIDAILKRSESRTASLQLLIEQAGLNITVGTLLLGSAAAAVLVFLILLRLTGLALIAVPVAAFAATVPVSVVKYMRTRRMRKFEEQFPEALDLLSRALRAGHAFTTGLEMIASEMADPIGPEFRVLYDQQNFGMPLPDALRLFAHRIPVLDARFFVTAVLIQRESGGNLSEVLDNLAKVMRERFRVKRQMRVISAHGRISGWILVALPPCLATVIFAINPETRDIMFNDPLGQKLMIAGVVLQVIGTLIMRKIINIPY